MPRLRQLCLAAQNKFTYIYIQGGTDYNVIKEGLTWITEI